VAIGDGNDSAGSMSESDVPSGDTRSRRGVSASSNVAKSNEPGEDDGEASPASSGGSPSTRGATASSNWAGSPVQGDDDDQSVEDATYAPSGGAPATCGVATRGAAALDGKMRSLASEGDDGSGAAGNFSRPSGARSRRGVALPSSSEEALKGYDGGRSLGIAEDDKIPSRARPRRGVPLPSDSEEALKGYDGDPGAAYHSIVPSGARSRRGVALPSDSGEALKGYDGGGMSGSRGSNKLFSGSATEISTAGGHSRRGAVAIGYLDLGNSPRRLWGESPQHDTATQMANRTAAKVASSLTHFTTGTGQRFAQAIPTAEIPKFVWREGQESKTMSQVFSDWLEAFSRHTKAYGPVHPTAAFDDPSFLAWLEVHWNRWRRQRIGHDLWSKRSCQAWTGSR